MAVVSVNGRKTTTDEAIDSLLYVDPYYGGSLEQVIAKTEKLEKLVTQLAKAYAVSAEELNFLTQYDSSYQYKDVENGI